MAHEGPMLCIPGLTASEDLSSYQYCLVKMSGANTVTYANATTDQAVGILQNKPGSGEAATVAALGVSKCRAGASITYGNKIASGAGGKGAGSTTATDWAIGIALESITLAATPTESELVTVLLTGPYHPANAS